MTFFVIESGTVDISVRNNKVGSLGPGQSFGELALMYNAPRAATIKANSQCALWTINRKVFRAIITHFKHVRQKVYVDFLKKIELLNKLTETEFTRMAAALEEEKFGPGHVIVR